MPSCFATLKCGKQFAHAEGNVMFEPDMPVIISLLRGVNVGGHHLIKMDALRALYESLGLRDAQTYLQSGNVVFGAERRDLSLLAKQIEDRIEKRFGFRPEVIVRTPSDFRKVMAGNPFAARRDINPSKLIVTFLAQDPGEEARKAILRIKTDPEELQISGRELYVYFPNGMGRSKLTGATIEKTLKTRGTARNWNTVRKLLDMAETLEASQ